MGQSSENRSTKCGILFEKYEKTLAQGVKEMVTFTHEEVFETMHPIKQAIDHLVLNHYDPGPLSLNSIVCSETYEIKLMDSFLHEAKLTLHQRPDFKTLLYE